MSYAEALAAQERTDAEASAAGKPVSARPQPPPPSAAHASDPQFMANMLASAEMDGLRLAPPGYPLLAAYLLQPPDGRAYML